MRSQTVFYSIAQGLSLTSAVIAVSISPIVGKALAPVPQWATLPYGMQFAAIIFCSYLLSMSMKRFGRKPVFLMGAIALGLGGALGALSIYWHSFYLNLLAHVFFGVSISAFAYFRFAATDGLDDKKKAKALSLVTLGGIVAAFIGPQIAQLSRLVFADYPFSASYLTFAALALLVMLIILFIPSAAPVDQIDKPLTEKEVETEHPKCLPLTLFVAIYASGFGYMIMALLMMQSSLKMNQMQVPFESIMFVIQCHVVAMFVPSLFMGRIISAIGTQKVILFGYIVMLVSMFIAIFISNYYGILAALIGIGLGWNMLYVGGSALVATLSGDAHKMQGINESAVAFLNAIGAFSAGWLFHNMGWENSNWLAMWLLLPGLVLLILSHKRDRKLQRLASVVI
jgi:predicted MFS family arabinose efflux permease